jgi:hypothetical protein
MWFDQYRGICHCGTQGRIVELKLVGHFIGYRHHFFVIGVLSGYFDSGAWHLSLRRTQIVKIKLSGSSSSATSLLSSTTSSGSLLQQSNSRSVMVKLDGDSLKAEVYYNKATAAALWLSLMATLLKLKSITTKPQPQR